MHMHTCTCTHTLWLTSFGTFGKLFFSEIDYANFSGFKTNSATIYQPESCSWNWILIILSASSLSDLHRDPSQARKPVDAILATLSLLVQFLLPFPSVEASAYLKIMD